ncbi:MalY/PatB family protein [Rosenbergiella australiborealis]|uniref:MalY/PatB family protein n=1 Tax=Rosenbergiella australiborealis TaxID=1544696 RepID=UPI001F4D50DD|nr:PatB family C-S lyase [Rosenbergiella australiborealis]
MSFNFDERVERYHTDSEKWLKYRDQDIIPLWVADTDFRVAPSIQQALQARVAHGVFGYAHDQGALANVTADWVSKQYHWTIDPDWVVPLSGIKPFFSLLQQCLLSTQQRSICHTPIYPPFTQSAISSGREQRHIPYPIFDQTSLLHSPLPALSHQDRLFLLCNPHNPGGRSHRRQELEQLAAYATEYNLWVCSDETHADLLLEPGLSHTPFAALSTECEQRSITLLSAAKAFNLAGLGCAVAIIPNLELRTTLRQAIALRMPVPNCLGVTATLAAWREGADWLNAQRDYLRANRDHLAAHLTTLPALRLITPEAGFLAWMDVSALGKSDPHKWFEHHGLGFTDGAPYGDPQAMRFNFGCSRTLLDLALSRLTQAVNAA